MSSYLLAKLICIPYGRGNVLQYFVNIFVNAASFAKFCKSHYRMRLIFAGLNFRGLQICSILTDFIFTDVGRELTWLIT